MGSRQVREHYRLRSDSKSAPRVAVSNQMPTKYQRRFPVCASRSGSMSREEGRFRRSRYSRVVDRQSRQAFASAINTSGFKRSLCPASETVVEIECTDALVKAWRE